MIRIKNNACVKRAVKKWGDTYVPRDDDVLFESDFPDLELLGLIDCAFSLATLSFTLIWRTQKHNGKRYFSKHRKWKTGFVAGEAERAGAAKRE